MDPTVAISVKLRCRLRRGGSVGFKLASEIEKVIVLSNQVVKHASAKNHGGESSYPILKVFLHRVLIALLSSVTQGS